MAMASIQTLTDSECRDLLAHSTFGRLGALVDGYPHIFPINYAVDRGTIAFRTDAGTKLEGARRHKVSLEVDRLEPGGRAAWSVLVLGTASVLTPEDSAAIRRLEGLAVAPFAPGQKPIWVRIVADRISGRRIVTDDVGFALDPRGHLGLYHG
jgi:nitroimidazol reductase NimA-like FMN-containing flavoprotein (pyridoxamine 5'-phosphate oxidase superfamily)